MCRQALIILACIGIVFAFCAHASSGDATGTWSGSYQPPATYLPLVLRISRISGVLKVETQSPNQSLIFNPADAVTTEKAHLSFLQARFNALFNANLSGNELIGTLSQQGNSSQLLLVRVMPEGEACKPADPFLGEWRGTVELRPAPIPLVLSIGGAGANLGATLQTPSINPTSFPVDSITYTDGTLTFHQTATGVDFNGKIAGTTLSGTLTQNGYTQQLVLQRQTQ